MLIEDYGLHTRTDKNGYTYCYLHGRLHNSEGPAVIFRSKFADDHYYLHGKFLTKKQWEQATGHV